MFHMSHLGPHTFVTEDGHHSGRSWLRHFKRDERHRLVEEDREARRNIIGILASAMMFGLALLAFTVIAFS